MLMPNKGHSSLSRSGTKHGQKAQPGSLGQTFRCLSPSKPSPAKPAPKQGSQRSCAPELQGLGAAVWASLGEQVPEHVRPPRARAVPSGAADRGPAVASFTRMQTPVSQLLPVQLSGETVNRAPWTQHGRGPPAWPCLSRRRACVSFIPRLSVPFGNQDTHGPCTDPEGRGASGPWKLFRL